MNCFSKMFAKLLAAVFFFFKKKVKSKIKAEAHSPGCSPELFGTRMPPS